MCDTGPPRQRTSAASHKHFYRWDSNHSQNGWFIVYGIVWPTLKLILGELPKKALVIPSGWRWPGWWYVADLGTAADSPQRQERRHQLQMPQKIWAPNLLSHQSQPNPWEPRKTRVKMAKWRLTTHFQHQKSTHFQHRLTPNTKNSLPTPKINSLPTQKALFGVEGESVFRFPIGTEASLLEPHHKQTLQGKWSTLRNPSRGFNPLGWGVGNIRVPYRRNDQDW